MWLLWFAGLTPSNLLWPKNVLYILHLIFDIRNAKNWFFKNRMTKNERDVVLARCLATLYFSKPSTCVWVYCVKMRNLHFLNPISPDKFLCLSTYAKHAIIICILQVRWLSSSQRPPFNCSALPCWVNYMLSRYIDSNTQAPDFFGWAQQHKNILLPKQ